MRLDVFLVKFVQGYLFSDLETMKEAGPPYDDGRVGYPMFAACASGIELLGSLISKKSIAEPQPSQNFVRYWRTYLYPIEPRRSAGMAIYQLIRHGVAHTFTSKAPTIAKQGPHLVNIDGVARVNVVQLADDLRGTYYTHVRPIVDGTRSGDNGETLASMQQRLNELLASYEANFRTHRSRLDILPSVSSTLIGLNSGTTDDVRTINWNYGADPTDLSSNSSFSYVYRIPRQE